MAGVRQIKAKTLVKFWLTVAAVLATFPALAQSYPSRPVRLVIPYAAGGTTDLIARVVMQKMTTIWGQPFVIDNRGGATGSIGTEVVVRSPPDGYTLLMNSGGMAISATLEKKLPYDATKSLSAVTDVANTPYFLFANAALPANSVQELIALDKSKPGQITYGSSGIGGTPHLSGEMFNLLAGTHLLHVPYKGTAAAINDVVGGQVQLMIVGLPSAQQFVKSGRLKILGVADSKRSSFYPDVPTIAEAGVPGYAAENWFGIFVPTGTPAAIEQKIADTVAQALTAPEVKEQLKVQGAVPVGSTPAEFKADFQRAVAGWGKVIRERHINPE